MRRWNLVAVLFVVVLGVLAAGCGNRSMFGTQLDHDLTDLNAALGRGDVELACARIAAVVPRFGEWAEGARGERAAVAKQLVEQLAALRTSCGAPESRNLASSWPPLYKEMRRISTYETSWLTVFTYVSMLGVGIGMYLFLRRLRTH